MKSNDVQLFCETVKRYPFGNLIITSKGNFPVTLRLPFIVDCSDTACLALTTHAANASLSMFNHADEHKALCIFNGDHSYISPSSYQIQPAVPTWNYLTAYAQGHLRIHEDITSKRQALIQAIDVFEPTLNASEDYADYISSLLNHITVFSVHIDAINVRNKTSQHRSPHDRNSIKQYIRDTQKREGEGYLDMLDWLEQLE